ncbi:MAG: tRNA (adenosine(37)-N6)-threonylcarbamoyltransferase complex dimerization subunit type 1 TsaB, partial [Paracoccaceae bacterium]|nr:tRNA (adenosine(37)-N6)-threonylcarbamoyltransferase complex dimerization subunit type 1 TsaB [Paracoccaceae bacterium]
MPPEPTVLAFDTSAAHCAAALLSGNNKLAERFEVQARGQAERLFPILEEMLDEAGLSWSDLNVIGVGVGPGNFTGIRISVAAARGLALSLGIPAVGVSVLEAQAEGLDGVVLSSLDGRRGQMYLQVFGDSQGSAPVLCDFDTLPPLPARAEPRVVGHAADRLAGAC